MVALVTYKPMLQAAAAGSTHTPNPAILQHVDGYTNVSTACQSICHAATCSFLTPLVLLQSPSGVTQACQARGCAQHLPSSNLASVVLLVDSCCPGLMIRRACEKAVTYHPAKGL